jgi:hypothetical protein
LLQIALWSGATVGDTSRNPSIVDAAVVGLYGLWYNGKIGIHRRVNQSQLQLRISYRLPHSQKDKPFDNYALLGLKGMSRKKINKLSRRVIRKLFLSYDKQHSKSRSRSKEAGCCRYLNELVTCS